MGLLEAFRHLGERVGMDEDELNSLLSENTAIRELPQVGVDLSDALAANLGEHGEAFEVFLADAGQALQEKDKKSELLWYPMIREGQWAVRPGAQGQKKKVPLKVVAGKSKNQRKEIGLQDLLDAFNDGAIEYVTIPENHDNKSLENTGFIRGMKIAQAPISSGPNKGKMASTLFGGYHFTSASVKQKVAEGSVAGRSCGILYDYINTETGKTYPAVVEHVALTNKPWITGMIPFGRKLSGVEGLSWDSTRLSDDEPPEEIMDDEEKLSDWAAEAGLELAKGDIAWDEEKAFSRIQEKAREALDALRQQHRTAMRTQPADAYTDFPDDFPSWCVRDCTDTSILIADGYGDGADLWSAPYKWDTDGQFELSAFTDWVKVKRVLVEDTSTDTVDTTDVVSDQPTKVSEVQMTPSLKLALAQMDRRLDMAVASADPTEYQKQLEKEIARLMAKGLKRSVAEQFAKRSLRRKRAATTNNLSTTHPRGGGKNVDEKDDNKKGLQLSDEAKAHIERIEADLQAERAKNEKLSQTVERVNATVSETQTDAWIEELKGQGFNEENGFGGALVELREIALADDGGEAVVSEKFSEDGKTDVALSVTDAFKRFFKAIKLGDDGKLALGQQLKEPADTTAANGDDVKGKEGGTNASADEKPGGGDKTELSTEEKVSAIAEANPMLGALIGHKPGAPEAVPAGSTANNGNGGESK